MVLLISAVLWVHCLVPSRHQADAPQPDPFSREVAAFKVVDRKNPPVKGQILFIGSSSFTKWTDVADYFPSYHILNRAFGGSRLPDVIAHVEDVVFPYQPKQIVIYCGENDFASDATLEPEAVFNRFRSLYRIIRNRIPNVPIAYVSMKPSPSRWNMRAKFMATNRKIADFLKHQKSASFIDVWDAMLDDRGQPKADIFIADKLHMNASGYHIWQPIIEPFLLKDNQ
jgi:lysophospholipase L1-like esterase